MKIFSLTVGIAAACLILASPVRAAVDSPVELPRTGKWVMNWDADGCSLAATFGDGNSRVLLLFQKFQPGAHFNLTALGQWFRSNELQNRLRIAFGPGQVLSQVTALAGSTGKLPLLDLGNHTLDGREFLPVAPVVDLAMTPEQESAISTFDIAWRGTHRRLNLGSMRAPMEAMRKCTTDLVRTWGLDPEVQGGLTRMATPTDNPGNWLRRHDYPRTLLAAGLSGIVRFRLDVDEAGNVSGCHIQMASRPEEFNDISCRLLAQRARFLPALDRAGKPVKSYFASAIRWLAG